MWEAFTLWQGWQRIGGGLKWLFAHPMAVLALALGVWGVIEHRAAAKWEGAYHKLVTDTQSAADKAAKDQAAVNHRPAAASAAIAEKSNADQSLYQAGLRAGAAYALAHQLRPQNSCGPGHTDLPGADHIAPVDDGQDRGFGDVMVAVSRDDFDRCTRAITRIAKVHNDAQALIAAGVAKPSEGK